MNGNEIPMIRALGTVGGAALIFCLAVGWGSYALAPGGSYVDWTMQGVSHDWQRYSWFLQGGPGLWRILAILGAFTGLLYAIVIVPVSLAFAAGLYWVFPPFKRWLLQTRGAGFWATVFFLGLVSGIVATIISGRNPGIP